MLKSASQANKQISDLYVSVSYLIIMFVSVKDSVKPEENRELYKMVSQSVSE